TSGVGRARGRHDRGNAADRVGGGRLPGSCDKNAVELLLTNDARFLVIIDIAVTRPSLPPQRQCSHYERSEAISRGFCANARARLLRFANKKTGSSRPALLAMTGGRSRHA